MSPSPSSANFIFHLEILRSNKYLSHPRCQHHQPFKIYQVLLQHLLQQPPPRYQNPPGEVFTVSMLSTSAVAISMMPFSSSKAEPTIIPPTSSCQVHWQHQKQSSKLLYLYHNYQVQWYSSQRSIQVRTRQRWISQYSQHACHHPWSTNILLSQKRYYHGRFSLWRISCLHRKGSDCRVWKMFWSKPTRDKKFDEYELDNIALSRLVVTSILSPTFLNKVYIRFGHILKYQHYPGSVLLMMVLETCHASTSHDISGVMKKFDELNLDSFPGENVTNLAGEALHLIKIMQSG